MTANRIQDGSTEEKKKDERREGGRFEPARPEIRGREKEGREEGRLGGRRLEEGGDLDPKVGCRRWSW